MVRQMNTHRLSLAFVLLVAVLAIGCDSLHYTQYVVAKASAADRANIKRAVEKLFGSKVELVRTAIAHGKMKRQGRFVGQRSDWKKAYVKLREGEKIPEFLEGA